MGLSVWQIALVVILLLLLFGRGKIPQLMGDLAEGIKSFKKGVAGDDDAPSESEPLAPAAKVEASKESV